jgi:hypothetical protein
MALGGLRTPTPQTVLGDLAVAFHLVPDQLRLNRRQDRLAFGDTEPQRGWGDPLVPVDGRDLMLNQLSPLDFRDQGDLPAHRCSSTAMPRLRIPRGHQDRANKGGPHLIACSQAPTVSDHSARHHRQP